MKPFHYQALPLDVYFGKGRVGDLSEILNEHGYHRVLVMTTPEQEESGQKLAAALGSIVVGVYPHAVMHVPIDVAEKATAYVREHQVDCCLALGGGSTIGLAKAVALTSGTPIAAVPTTYAGSEMTSVYGLTDTDKGRKTTGKDPRVQPKVVVYDPELTFTLPPQISAASGMNAMAHAVEALYAENKNPIISMMATESIRALKNALPEIVRNPKDEAAREQAFYGSWLAGICLGSVGMAVHHKICHTLGGTFNLPHAQAHAITLPYSVQYNRNADEEAMKRLADALDVDNPQECGLALYRLNQSLGIPMSLKEIGLPEHGAAEVAKIVCDSPYYNPRPYVYEELFGLLQKAYLGQPPA
ncbi:maleylacetate reductase [Neisseria montereyensis]|uniref:Maleylacetate reductase n=1 Tax=Neisseria montereyensis TaxID=2973938 RepID=A0ABT2FBD4_9NEIS|nr:maleylacetate reductase [Neisseria montereyensis]MCS4533486.1 maleylacetate reductase [Neisseria montereyensis]